MQTVKVHMLAHNRVEAIRNVTLPDGVEYSRDNVYYYGQNDFAVGPELNTTVSVSAGDVIEEADGTLVMIQAVGFAVITPEQLAAYKRLPQRDRTFDELVFPR